MKIRILTHAEKDLSGTMPDLWPEFVTHDPIVNTFWPRLYEVYPDFQLWVLDGRTTVAYGCTLPVRWDGIPEPRGIDWAMTNGVAGEPSTLCAIVVGIVPEYRGKGLAAALLRRMASVAAAHGLDELIAPVRPTWKERYPLTPMERYITWRRADGQLLDPWLRVHERLGAEILGICPGSLVVTGTVAAGVGRERAPAADRRAPTDRRFGSP